MWLNHEYLDVARRLRVSRAAHSVYMALILQACEEQSMVIFPSTAHLAGSTPFQERTVKKALGRLEQHRLIAARGTHAIEILPMPSGRPPVLFDPGEGFAPTLQ